MRLGGQYNPWTFDGLNYPNQQDFFGSELFDLANCVRWSSANPGPASPYASMSNPAVNRASLEPAGVAVDEGRGGVDCALTGLPSNASTCPVGSESCVRLKRNQRSRRQTCRSRSEASWHPESAVDSDLAWAKATDYTYFDGRSSQWLPFLVLLREGVTFQAFQENFASLVEAGTVRVAPAFWPEDPSDSLGSLADA